MVVMDILLTFSFSISTFPLLFYLGVLYDGRGVRFGPVVAALTGCLSYDYRLASYCGWVLSP